MANFSNLSLFVVVSGLVLVSIVAGDTALRCWRCSTDVSNGDFCNDPFHPETISAQQHYWSYVNCTYSTSPKSGNVRAICKKLVQEVYGKRVISRSCFYVDVNDLSSGCEQETTSSFIQTLSCETCSTDGCNAGNTFTAMTVLIFIPCCAILFNVFKKRFNIE